MSHRNLSWGVRSDGYYRALISDGENDPSKENGYNMHTWMYTGGLIVETYVKDGKERHRNYYDPGTNGFRYPWSPSSESKLISKIVSDLKGHDFNAAVFGAELPKALSGVTSSARAVFESYRQFRRGRPGDAFRTLSRAVQGIRPGNKPTPLRRHDVSDAMLAMTYGYVPLINDVYESMEAIEKITGPARVYKSRFRAQFETYLNQGVSAPVWQRILLRKEYRVMWMEQISAPRTLGFSSPALVAWELVPFSFVVDWFIPVGAYLENASYCDVLKQVAYGSSLFQSKEGRRPSGNCGKGAILYTPHYSWCSPANPKDQFVSHSSADARYREVWLDRAVGTGISVPPPSLNNIDKAFSLTHLSNAAALISSLMPRH